MEPEITPTLMDTVTVAPGVTRDSLCPTDTVQEVISSASAACGVQKRHREINRGIRAKQTFFMW
jgi:methyl coenzyme M reductase subunit C